MQVLFLVDGPKYTRHPTLRPLFDILQGTGQETIWCTQKQFLNGAYPAPDVILLKNGMEDPRILNLAEELMAKGTRVINTPAATRMVEDRLDTDNLLASAGLPVPPRFSGPDDGAGIPPPYFRKPRSNYKHNLSRVESFAEMAFDPGYYYQQSVPNDDVVRKLYIIGQDVFLVTRDGPHFADFERKHLEHRVLHETPALLQDWALQVGVLTGLDAYGVDVVGLDDEFYIIDVNPFPGYVGVPQAPECFFKLIAQQ
ncbi:MAG TPA: hypothetical protein VKK79_20095 [Candidatus Lokiarchaeia archaeon]|nr:hypothetical protein [Candidatus Lokiarchaeia archaeon]